MKRTHNVKVANYNNYEYTDTRYYGLFRKNKDSEHNICIDPIRYKKTIGIYGRQDLDKMMATINKRHTHYFYPAKKKREDYMCNLFFDDINSIKVKWENQFKPLINEKLAKIEKPKKLTPGDCELYNCGILEPDEVSIWSNVETWRNQERYISKCAELAGSLYSQFLHQLASSIEASTVKVLTIKNGLEDKFNRNVLYATTTGKGKSVKELTNFKYYDELYCLWNFLKHNSISTYESLKKVSPEILVDEDYKQGNPALEYVRFSDKLIESLIDGNIEFFKEYCKIVFDEDFEEAQWNYEDYFENIVCDEIEMYSNPFGIPDYI